MVAIEQAFRITNSALEDMTRKRDKQRLQLDGFKTDLKKRLKAQKQFRKTTEKLLRHKFKSYMNKRKHRGTLSIDFENQTLSFDVTVTCTVFVPMYSTHSLDGRFLAMVVLRSIKGASNPQQRSKRRGQTPKHFLEGRELLQLWLSY